MTDRANDDSPGLRLGLRWKIVALCVCSAAVVAGSAVAALAVGTRAILLDGLREQARSVSSPLAETLSFAAATRNEVILRSSAENAVRSSPRVAWVAFRDRSGALLASARAEGLPDDTVTLAGPPGASRDRELQLPGVHVLEVNEPVHSAEALGTEGATDDVVAVVQVALRADALQRQVATVTLRSLAVAAALLVLAALAALALARRMIVPLERLASAAAEVARGDLRQSVAISGSDEIAALAGSFQSMATGLRGMTADLQHAASQVEMEASQIHRTASDQVATNTQQASAIAETSATITEIAQTAKHASEHADEVIRVSRRSEDLSAEGERAVDEVVSGIEGVGEQVRAIAGSIATLSDGTLRIGEIIATVKDVAEQSNVLALNAAIEASKAGDHGRGFGVVASEMRSLADQSRRAAEQVRGILGEIQRGTRATVDATEEGARRTDAALALARRAGDSIVGLAEVIRASSLAARQIANETRQQAVGVEQIVMAIGEVSEAVRHTADGTRDIERGTANLDTVSRRLASLVGRYQV